MKKQLVEKISTLSNLSITKDEAEQFSRDFSTSMEVVDELFAINTEGVEPTYQVNDLKNVWREDVVNEETQFTQAQALVNAPRKYQGYFVVERIIDRET
ncbi:MAG: Asp-tRNA(Asn)/Glu-tRNA(Gln) amidotransferase subunit GatC [Pseudomonadales bacterium]|jgi:aspartyl-tRNA(Asn)/glutamyl-tRNA(Gln) amidotransferase subunit C|nr:Asp-tRNA(Asn)/Glu-tRNA(Gln) amidotransferase subunit GatC [Pseudomonadales bacterium]